MEGGFVLSVRALVPGRLPEPQQQDRSAAAQSTTKPAEAGGLDGLGNVSVRDQ